MAGSQIRDGMGASPDFPHLPVGIFSRKREKNFFDFFQQQTVHQRRL
ncbi:MAG: hypothetical protein IPK97_12035 [Ahniella sp.]|nr:hypothetical protein [Ahniella sp.]